ncbi:MAG TPA: copper resistance protein B [Rhodanobacteraceae bacterium]|nr:copper resistance protein B [Rhodanobacteraceae bacterium]
MNAPMKTMTSACVLAIAFATGAPAATQDATQQPMAMTNMPMPKPKHDEHQHPSQSNTAMPASAASVATPRAMPDMEMSSVHHASTAPEGARSPDYSDGYRYGSMQGMDMRDDSAVGALLLSRMEYVRSRGGGNAVAIDGEAWYGRNFDKLWLKFEGERAEGRLQDLRTEALWSHAVTAFWDRQLGVRHDFGAGPERTWAAFGVEGLAPYWFETEATFYVGQGGRTAARAAFEYEARFTQRLILQPSLEANFYGRDDPQRDIGSGLSDIEAGLRLRYELRREFAPYAGIVWQQRFGRTRDYLRAQGESADDLQFVAGVRMWF